MDTNYKKLFTVPTWAEEENLKKANYDLILSNDLDSWLSCRILGSIFNFDVKYFYDFKTLYKMDGFQGERDNRLGIDIDLVSGKSIGNHVQAINKHDSYNKESVNLNYLTPTKIHGSDEIYFSKYNLSTLLMVLYLCKMEIPDDEIIQMLILCIDGSYLSFYSRHPRDRAAHKRYLVDILGFEKLYRLEQRKTKEDFDKISEEFGLKVSIFIDKDGKLQFNKSIFKLWLYMLQAFKIDIDLPNDKFEVIERFKTIQERIPKNNTFTKEKALINNKNIFSQVMTGQYHISFSYN